MNAPTLTTDRLILARAYARGLAWFAVPSGPTRGDPVHRGSALPAGRGLGPDPALCGAVGPPGVRLLGRQDRETGRFVGEVGFADFRRAITPALGDRPEAGWILSPSAHGRGFAREAMDAALGWIASAGHSRTRLHQCAGQQSLPEPRRPAGLPGRGRSTVPRQNRPSSSRVEPRGARMTLPRLLLLAMLVLRVRQQRKRSGPDAAATPTRIRHRSGPGKRRDRPANCRRTKRPAGSASAD
jgi:GNAT superfamily N-acetyltransferase